MVLIEKNFKRQDNGKHYLPYIRSTIFYFVAFILVLIPAVVPLGFSPDSFMYYRDLTLSPDKYNFLVHEPLYWLFVYINRILFNSNWVSFVLMFSITYVGLSLYLIRKYSIDITLSLIIFFLFFYPIFGIMQIRNGVAVAFMWWAFFNFIDGKKRKFIMKAFLATLFHYSAILLPLLLLIKKDKINKVFYFLLPILGILLGQFVFRIDFYQAIIRYLPVFLRFKAQGYLNYLLYNPTASMNQLNVFNIYSLFSLLVYYISLTTNLKERYFKVLVKTLGFALFTYFSLKVVPVFASRISNSFFTFVVFLLPYILKPFKKYEKFIIYYSFIIILIFVSWNLYVRHTPFHFYLLKF